MKGTKWRVRREEERSGRVTGFCRMEHQAQQGNDTLTSVLMKSNPVSAEPALNFLGLILRKALVWGAVQSHEETKQHLS